MNSHIIHLGTTLGTIALVGCVGASIGVGSAFWLYNAAANESTIYKEKYIHYDV
jgi:hypothetical protein